MTDRPTVYKASYDFCCPERLPFCTAAFLSKHVQRGVQLNWTHRRRKKLWSGESARAKKSPEIRIISRYQNSQGTMHNVSMTPSKFFKFLKTTKLRRCCFANSWWRGSQKCQNLSAPSTLKAIFLISFNIAWVIHLSFRPVQTICLERPHRKNRKQNHRKSCIHAVFLIFWSWVAVYILDFSWRRTITFWLRERVCGFVSFRPLNPLFSHA